MGEIKFTKTHEWARINNDIATAGITDHAQSELGDIVFVELPSVGDEVTQNSQCATVESTKAASEVYAPLSGKIDEINEELVNNPQLINESPFDKGWMFKIKIKDRTELDNLMDEATYKEFIEKESH
mgnify:CR=1 FL=1